MFNEVSVSAVFVAITIGLVQAAKIVGMPSRFAPILAIAVAFGLQFALPGPMLGMDYITAVVVGLTASGLYAGTKATVQG